MSTTWVAFYVSSGSTPRSPLEYTALAASLKLAAATTRTVWGDLSPVAGVIVTCWVVALGVVAGSMVVGTVVGAAVVAVGAVVLGALRTTGAELEHPAAMAAMSVAVTHGRDRRAVSSLDESASLRRRLGPRLYWPGRPGGLCCCHLVVSGDSSGDPIRGGVVEFDGPRNRPIQLYLTAQDPHPCRLLVGDAWRGGRTHRGRLAAHPRRPLPHLAG